MDVVEVTVAAARRGARVRSAAVRAAALVAAVGALVPAAGVATAGPRPVDLLPPVTSGGVHIPALHQLMTPDVLAVSPKRVPLLTAIETRVAPGVEGVASVGVGRARLDGHG